MDGASEVARLRAENDRLIALLESHGIDSQASQSKTHKVREPEPSRLSTAEKVSLFRRLLCGRTDAYPIRWEAKTSGKSGYSPACANEWRSGVCEKPRIKGGDCGNRVLIPLFDVVIDDHLAGEHAVGAYPLLEDDSCYFLAVDFDEAEWREDAWAFMQSSEALVVPAALEISRSGKGTHVWVFFAGRVSARDDRRLGTAITSLTCSRTRQLKLGSYDRLFPSQDTMPKGVFGNLIALPLQKGPREQGYSYPQHIALPRGCLDAAMSLLRENGIACDLRDERFGGQPLDVSFVGSLRLDQEAAVAGLLPHDAGVLCAPTAFGKTVTAAAMIARRGVNTLVLVHRTELLKQWQERLQAFLGVAKGVVGTIGGGKTDVRIIDFEDTGHPALLRMWDERQRGYRAMGYRIGAGGSPE